jgi:hypothetical protein
MKILSAFAIAVLIAGCDDGHNHDGEDGHDHAEHAHAAKNGGALRELGDHEGFAELKADHAAGTVTLWVYQGEEMTAAKITEAPMLNLKTGKEPVQIKGVSKGDTWVFAHDALKSEFESARLQLTMNGKSYTPEWKHDHDHADEHGEGEGHDHEGEGHGKDEHEGHDHDGDDHKGHDDDHDHEHEEGDKDHDHGDE